MWHFCVVIMLGTPEDTNESIIKLSKLRVYFYLSSKRRRSSDRNPCCKPMKLCYEKFLNHQALIYIGMLSW